MLGSACLSSSVAPSPGYRDVWRPRAPAPRPDSVGSRRASGTRTYTHSPAPCSSHICHGKAPNAANCEDKQADQTCIAGLQAAYIHT